MVKSGRVTGVGVAYLILGGLAGLLGLTCLAPGSFAWHDPGLRPPGVALNPVRAILGFWGLIWGLPAFLGGLGVLRRKQWGRILTLIAAFLLVLFNGFLGVAALLIAFFREDPSGAAAGVIWLVPLGVAIWAIAVLLNRSYAAEFNVPRGM
jgi:hypothetical protein